MLDVLIVDDEPNVRNGLKIIIPWEENGFRICSDAGNAEEGIEKILHFNPNIVLMDIKLPGKLGLDVIREVQNQGFKGKFIIISGYSNFDYAKDAIKYGVKSYILKPVDEDELLEILLELKKEIEEEWDLEESKNLTRINNLRKLILGENIILKEDYSKYDYFQTCSIEIENFSNDILLEEDFKIKFNNILDEVDIIKIDKKIVCLFKELREDRIIKKLENLREKFIKEYSRGMFITVGNKVKNIEEINKSFLCSKKLMEEKFLYLEKGIINSQSIESSENIEEINKEYFINKIYGYIEISEYNQLKAMMIKLLDYFKANHYSETKIKIVATKMILDLRERVDRNYNIKNIMEKKEQVMEDIHSFNSLVELINYLTKSFIEISNKIGDNSSDNIIKKMVNYINHNYYCDLKLEGLAEIFNYNSAYLGKLFKSQIGENFNVYMDKVRIEKAKILLKEENIKVYEVSEKIGYKNIDYFHSKFKKYVGMSPLNYKKINTKK